MKKIFKQYPFLVITICIGLISLLLLITAFDQRNTLKIIFLDVGQGDATLIQTPSGKNILIDTGAKNSIANTSVLLTGDAGKLTESELIEVYGDTLNADILKIGHHGSQTSTLNTFVKTVSPKHGIVSAGCDNRFGHPHGGVLTTLFQNRVEVLETCQEGDIIFESDGVEWTRK